MEYINTFTCVNGAEEAKRFIMPEFKRRYYHKGFTLIEVLVAMSILSAGILAIISLFPLVTRNVESNWQNNNIAMIAQEKMDELISNNNPVSSYEKISEPLPEKYKGFIRYWGGPRSESFQTVYVQVVWNEKGQVKEYTLVGAVSP
jgi:type II secretion system protein I